jgi:hypothetical protein
MRLSWLSVALVVFPCTALAELPVRRSPASPRPTNLQPGCGEEKSADDDGCGEAIDITFSTVISQQEYEESKRRLLEKAARGDSALAPRHAHPAARQDDPSFFPTAEEEEEAELQNWDVAASSAVVSSSSSSSAAAMHRRQEDVVMRWEQPQECNVRSTTGKHCHGYAVEMTADGNVAFDTVVENLSDRPFKWAVACGLRDGAGNVYTFARSGLLWGKSMKNSRRRGLREARIDFVANEDVRANWGSIVDAAVPGLGPNWGNKPLLECKFNEGSSATMVYKFHRPELKRSAMTKMQDHIERDYGQITRFIDLFI